MIILSSVIASSVADQDIFSVSAGYVGVIDVPVNIIVFFYAVWSAIEYAAIIIIVLVMVTLKLRHTVLSFCRRHICHR